MCWWWGASPVPASCFQGESPLQLYFGGSPTLLGDGLPSSGTLFFVGVSGAGLGAQSALDGSGLRYAIGVPPELPAATITAPPYLEATVTNPGASVTLSNPRLKYYFRFEPEPRRLGVTP